MVAPHIESMESENAELGVRIDALRTFRDQSPIYSALSDFQRHLLAAQLQAMTCYKTVLSLRIENDKKSEEVA